ncbi:MAG TPA: phosphoribosyltransferase family protein [Ktedonobacterales bacterium]|nr:phosphoribosyltransferase family protein [Ktedonobacterales bacterium]
MKPRDYLSLIDTHTSGLRYDVTPLFADAAAFAAAVDDLLALVGETPYDLVAGVDALGFILGAALALRAGKGFVPVRKGGKLPVAVETVEFVDYSGTRKALELRRDAIAPGVRVLVVDEWIETGAQIGAAIRLIKGCGGVVVGVATIHVDDNERTRQITARYPVFQLWPEG